ncbi:MAG TPA: hypothetical protein DD435_02270 [Cyanobacteria bacterium UBA8530]|nr:hypothetical protein [Cyanobacteria bacterium UBA8530]
MNGPHPALSRSITAEDPRYSELVDALFERNQKLLEENRLLAEMDEHRISLIACVSHELRTPLSYVMGYGSILQEGVMGELNPKQQNCLRKMMEGSEQLLRIISDLLVFSKMDAGKFALQLAPTNLAPLLDEVVRQMAPTFESNELTLELRLTVPLPEIQADADRLRQVLYNLLENASKFTPKGGRVTLSCRLAERGIRLEVVDNGIGIAPEHLDRIFERFYQIPGGDARQKKGSGLGLAITRDIIEGHGGAIKVVSSPEQGTAFKIFLPLPQ